MHGSGTYSIGSVKEIMVTNDFHTLDETNKNCQSLHSIEKCINNQLLEKMKKNCKCIPYELSNFNSPKKVGKSLIAN